MKLHNRKTGQRSVNRPLWTVVLLLLIVLSTAAPVIAAPPFCERPLTYRIGKIDERYGLSKREARDIIQRAAAVWGDIYLCEFFREDPQGRIVINFVYDERMGSIDMNRMWNKGSDLHKGLQDKQIALKDTYKADLKKKREALQEARKAYTSRYNMWDVKSQFAGMQGELSEKDKQYLKHEPAALEALKAELARQEKQCEALQARIDELKDEIADSQEIIDRSHNMRAKLPEKMVAGTYTREYRKRTIDVYLNYKRRWMIRLLAHEFGHALGIGWHTEDPDSIMFAEMRSYNITPTYDDRAALRKVFNGLD